MSYIIKKSDGTILTELIDGTTDQVHSSLTLVAKSASSYGSALNENFVYLLENFANTTQPRTPIVGQLWFDTTQNRLKVYDGVNFKVSGGTIVASTAPSGISAGDIWIDSTNGQLRFNDGTATTLAGPIFTRAQGLSGFVVDTIFDTAGVSHTIASMFVGQSLIGIWSNADFTPKSPISQYTGPLYVGFNASTFAGVKLHVPVTQADTLLAADGSTKTAENFISTNDDGGTSGTLSITNNKPLILGSESSTEIDVSSALFNIVSNASGQNFKITTRFNTTQYPSLFIDATNNRVGIFNSAPSATLHVGSISNPGDVIIEGSLTVNGTTTTVTTNDLIIKDKNIVLGYVSDNNIGNGTITTIRSSLVLGVVGFTKAGTSVTAAATYTGKTQLSTSGNGTGAVFTIIKTGSGTSYSTATISVTNAGNNYAVGDTIVISGADLGGATPLNNLTLTVISDALAGPWIATITNIYSTSGLITGSVLNATSGTGRLYSGSPSSVTIASIVSPTSITYQVVGGSIPTAGSVTSIIVSASNTSADGGGITLKGSTDKKITWVNSSSSWTSSEHVNLAIGKEYRINDTTVLTSDTLASSIQYAPGLQEIGSLLYLNVANILITSDNSGSAIFANSTPILANGDIILNPKGTGVVSVSNSKISDVAEPQSAQDATTKNYTDNQFKTRSVAISLTTTGLSNSQIAITYLSKLFPNTEWLDSSTCRAVCTDGAVTTIKRFVMQTGTWVYQNDL